MPIASSWLTMKKMGPSVSLSCIASTSAETASAPRDRAGVNFLKRNYISNCQRKNCNALSGWGKNRRSKNPDKRYNR